MKVQNEFDSSWDVPEFELLHWRGKRKDYCVVIPVINEGRRISRLLQRMDAQRIADIADVLIVDGGSTDGSIDVQTFQSLNVGGILRKTGGGQLSAQLRCGYAFALANGYNGVVTIDGNDKDDPSAIASFVDALAGGVDFVQGSRFIDGGKGENTPLGRYLAIRWIHAPLLSLSSGFRWTDTTQGFRAYSRRMLADIRIAPFRSVFATYELLAYLSCRAPQLGFRCVELPTRRAYPVGGEVPTKIKGLVGNLALIKILIKACLGHFAPPRVITQKGTDA